MQLVPYTEVQSPLVTGDVYRIEPPIIRPSHNGDIIAIHAAYNDAQTGDEVPIGMVVTRPSEEPIVHMRPNVPCSEIYGVVGKSAICKLVSSTSYREFGGISNYTPEFVVARTSRLQKDAAYQVLARLGIDASDLLAQTPEVHSSPEKRRFFGRSRK